jgi:uncharacterized protein (TIGR00369 family)
LTKLHELPREELEKVFSAAPFVADLGVRLLSIGPGQCETDLAVEPRHQQQNGFVHAGVQATMADHTAGAAAATMLESGQHVLTVEFKINLLRAARGNRLRCRAVVLKPGSRVVVVESEVHCERDDNSSLVSKAIATMAVVDAA